MSQMYKDAIVGRTPFGGLRGSVSLETTLLQIVHLCTLRSKAQFLTGIPAAISAITNGNFVGVVTALVMEFGEKLDDDDEAGKTEVATGDATEQAGAWEESEKLRIGFGTLMDNWTKLRHCVLGKHLRKILAIIVCGGLAGTTVAANYPRLYEFAMGSVDVSKYDAFDIMGEALMTVRVVWDSMARCVVEQKWSALLSSDSDLCSIETELAFLRAHFDWYTTGALERTTALAGEVVQEVEFITRVDKLLTKVKTAHKRAHVPAERLVLAKYMGVLSDYQSRIRERQSRGTTRPEPFTLKLDGTTSVGKTVDMVKITRDILKIAGFPSSDEHIACIDPGSKFFDTITNATQGAYVDDMANTLPEFSQTDDGRMVIMMKNSAKTPVPKAAVEEKGGTFLDVKVFLVSTNCPDLHAFRTSVEGSSILRRFQYHILVEVAPGFERENVEANVQDLKMLDASKLVNGIATQSRVYTIREWIPYSRDASTAAGKPHDTGRFVVRQSRLKYGEMMRWLRPKVVEHFARQRRFLEDMERDETAPLCQHGYTTAPHCQDCIDAAEAALAPVAANPGEQAGESFVDRVAGFFVPEISRPASPVPSVSSAEPEPESPEPAAPPPAGDNRDPLVELVLPAVRPRNPAPVAEPSRVRVWRKHAWDWARMKWMDVAEPPTAPRERPAFVGLVQAMSQGRFSFEDTFITSPASMLMGLYGFVPVSFAMFTRSLFWLFGAGSWSAWPVAFVFFWSLRSISHMTVQYVRSRMMGMTLTELSAKMRAIAVRNFGIIAAVVVSGLAVAAFVKLQQTPVENGGCQSAPQEMPAAPDPVAKEKHWERRDVMTFRQLPATVKTMTFEQAVARIRRQLMVVDVHYSDRVVRTNALMVVTNHALMPKHNFVRKDGTYSKILKLVFRVSDENKGPTFVAKIDANSLIALPGDCMLVQTNTGGTMHDLTEFFGEKLSVSAVPVFELFRNLQTYEVEEAKYLAHPVKVRSSQYGWSYAGLTYKRASETFVGLCGALQVVAGRWPQIASFHTMGDGCVGYSCAIEREEVLHALELMRLQACVASPVVVMHDTELATPAGYEKACEVGELSAKSVLRTAPVGAPMVPIGTLVSFNQVRAKSRLGVSPISTLVEELCGEPRLHGPPRTIGRTTVEITKLQELAGLEPIDPKWLKMAAQDMHDELEDVVVGCGLQRFFRPLTELEMCSGIAGSSSVRRLKLSTAAGFPRTGPKFSLVEPSPTKDLPEAIVLTPAMREEVAELEEKMSRRERVNFVFKGSHKDEPTKLTKEKTRVFEGAPMAMTLLIRKFFYPIMRIYSLAMPWTESAVGINAVGSDWHEMACWMMEYNEKFVLEGDWVHYDMSIANQEMMTLFSIWISIAEKFGTFTPEQINVMWVLAEEISCHYSLFKGDVCMMNGTNPSGNGVTVYINNGVNGLRMRAAFYALAPEHLQPTELWQPLGVAMGGASYLDPTTPMSRDFDQRGIRAGIVGRFADYVRAIFYGDDFQLAAKDAVCDWFNQKTLAEWFAVQGKVMTAADKSAVVRETTPWEEATFLKRRFRPDPNTMAIMGPLEMTSIYKSLHVWPVATPMSPAAHAADVIMGSLRELFNHGAEEFMARAPPLLEVAKRFGAYEFMPEGCGDYAVHLAAWSSKYGDACHGV